ncbi:MAG: hypothetical protein KKE79_09205 [Actinobacteria bacterium]|nr:hypothetical protein [Actinomycetota bacterium]MBU4301290.1 hypothetical protein [Actinomycetota bacterium]MBU4490794.1 hypothetical protein [Actinomycetota bacterium]MCG2796773.1 hypothetical protein [Actinomycetes bacterium]
MGEFRLEGGSVDAASLQENVARRVEERRQAGVYTHEVESRLAELLPDEEESGGLPPAPALDYAATRAFSAWEVTTAYPVDTEKRLVRPLVMLVKRLARLWARIAVGPMQREQTAFNRHVAMALQALREHAITSRARAKAAEEDLCRLAGSLIHEGEARAMSSAVVEALGGASRVAVLGPCPVGLVNALGENGMNVLKVSPGSSWDDRAAGGTGTLSTGPVSFLWQVEEKSLEAVLLSDLAFWLRPEALVGLSRRSYLALQAGGAIAVAVHRYALGGPAPAWCDPAAVEKALELAGFTGISTNALPEGCPGDGPAGFVTSARKR